ncbi:MAG: Hpt domain-containing protein [Thiobacillaceae bacterium]|nr:Hpt domain-containing protein [Thiobacillaceae bacterium]
MSAGMSQFEAVLRQMRAGFLAELPERCDRLEDSVLALERGQSSQDAYQELYRNVHSLKGSGGTFGLSIVTSICHQFENFLTETAGRYTQAFGSAALGYIDLLRRAAELAARDKPDYAPIEASLERMRQAMLRSRSAVLIADSSATMRGLYQQILHDLPLQISVVDNGMAALDRLLHQPFDLLIAARELDGLNALAVVAALRASNHHNRDIPVILISSSQDDLPAHLRIHRRVPRDRNLAESLPREVGEAIRPA